jgi:hypothetical protein
LITAYGYNLRQNHWLPAKDIDINAHLTAGMASKSEIMSSVNCFSFIAERLEDCLLSATVSNLPLIDHEPIADFKHFYRTANNADNNLRPIARQRYHSLQA